jgi:hypothetical protein
MTGKQANADTPYLVSVVANSPGSKAAARRSSAAGGEV